MRTFHCGKHDGKPTSPSIRAKLRKRAPPLTTQDKIELKNPPLKIKNTANRNVTRHYKDSETQQRQWFTDTGGQERHW